MINAKIVILGFYFPAYTLMLIQWMIAQGIIKEVNLTSLEMILWASIISFIGGVSAAYRSSLKPNDLLRSGLNTAIMGGCLAAIATYVTLERPALAWLVIGLSGLLSLGGLATVDWVRQLAQKKFGKKINDS